MQNNRDNIKYFLKNLIIDRLLKDSLSFVQDTGDNL
jgi:hypothetical protein